MKAEKSTNPATFEDSFDEGVSAIHMFLKEVARETRKLGLPMTTRQVEAAVQAVLIESTNLKQGLHIIAGKNSAREN